MRIRFARWRLLAALTVAAFVVVALSLSSTGRWTPADFDRIEVGILRADVERILGPPWIAQPMKGRVEGGTFIVRLGPGVQPHEDDRDYLYAGWNRVALTKTYSGVVIFDGDHVACRYIHVLPGGRWEQWRARIRSLF